MLLYYIHFGIHFPLLIFAAAGFAAAQKKRCGRNRPQCFGAGDEARTRYLHLGKVALYRMSYTRISNAGMIIAEDPKKSSIFFKFLVQILRVTAAYRAAACGR